MCIRANIRRGFVEEVVTISRKRVLVISFYFSKVGAEPLCMCVCVCVALAGARARAFVCAY